MGGGVAASHRRGASSPEVGPNEALCCVQIRIGNSGPRVVAPEDDDMGQPATAEAGGQAHILIAATLRVPSEEEEEEEDIRRGERGGGGARW